MELVPWNQAWSETGTKLDIKAIYRRGEVLTTLPVRRHSDWVGKGWTYITLATAEDVVAVKPGLRAVGVNLDELQKSYASHGQGAFRMDAYLKELARADASFVADVQSKVDKFGYDAVFEMMKVQDPEFVMPEGVTESPKKTAAKKGEAA
jgi:hypothetical protein